MLLNHIEFIKIWQIINLFIQITNKKQKGIVNQTSYAL